MPNLVQTLENNPAFVHGGPFANIAHGCNSVIATAAALKLADYVVTEAGFGADLGAEKFFDIKCRKAGLHPAVAVLVATVRALKMHGGVARDDLRQENVEALQQGARQPRPPYREPQEVRRAGGGGDQPFHHRHRGARSRRSAAYSREHGVDAFRCTHWADGSKGMRALSRHVIALADKSVEPVHAHLWRRHAALGEDQDHRPRDLSRRRHRRRQGGARSAAVLRGAGLRQISRSAWPRPSIRFPPTPISRARPSITWCRSAR